MTAAASGSADSALVEARAAATTALKEKADEVMVLDLRGLAGFTSFFVIATAGSERRRRTVMDRVERELRTHHQRKPIHTEGYPAAGWLLADYVDFVVHVFSPESRAFYRLERLWGDAARWSPQAPAGGEAPAPDDGDISAIAPDSSGSSA